MRICEKVRHADKNEVRSRFCD